MRQWDKSRSPTGPWALDRDSWRAQGLVGWWPAGGAACANYLPDLSAGANAHMDGPAGTPKIGRLPDGAPGLVELNGSTQYQLASKAAVTAIPFSMSCWCMPTTIDSNEHTMLSISGASNNALNRLTVSATNKASMQFRNSGGTTSNAFGTVTLVAGTHYHIGGNVTAGGTAQVWTNGKDKQAGGAAGGSMESVQNTTLGVLYRASAAQLLFAGAIGECAIYNRLLEDWQMEALADPAHRFALWYPLRSRKWFVAGAGTLISVSDAGSGTESLAIAVSVGLTDAGSAAETVNNTAQVTVTDTGAAVETLGVSAAIVITDAGAGGDTVSVAVSLSIADSGTAAEVISVLQATLITVADLASGAETIAVTVSVPVTDSGTGIDQIVIAALVSLLDAAQGADVVVRTDQSPGGRIARVTFTLRGRSMSFALRTRSMTFTLQ